MKWMDFLFIHYETDQNDKWMRQCDILYGINFTTIIYILYYINIYIYFMLEPTKI